MKSTHDMKRAMKKTDDYMNPPNGMRYQAEIQSEGIYDWVVCPYCGKRAFMITPGAVIRGQLFKCRGSNCKREFEVNFDLRAM